jgi:DHA2 family multidrug resistance protein
MLFVGKLVNYIDARWLLATGFTLLAYSTFLLSHINLGISISSIIWPNMLNGFAGGFIFVPLTTLTMSGLRREEIGNAAGIYNLMRNIGGSIGIASITTCLVRHSQAHQTYLVQNVTAGRPSVIMLLHGLQSRFISAGASSTTSYRMALQALYNSVQQQAALLSYADDFRLLAMLSLACIPLLLLFRKVRRHPHDDAIEGTID